MYKPANHITDSYSPRTQGPSLYSKIAPRRLSILTWLESPSLEIVQSSFLKSLFQEAIFLTNIGYRLSP